MSFSDFVDIASKELMRENMEAAIITAASCGLSSMTMEDIYYCLAFSTQQQHNKPKGDL